MKLVLTTLSIIFVFIYSGCTETDSGYQGYIDVDYTNLSTETTGTIVSIPVTKGIQVKSGDLLLKLDDTKEKLETEALQAQLENAENLLADMQSGKRVLEREIIEAQLAEAKAALENAETEFQRYLKLFQQKAVSASIFETKETVYKTAQARVDAITHQRELSKEGNREYQVKAQEATIAQMKAKIEEAKYMRSLTSLYSPEDAMVFDVYYRKGELLQAGHVALRLISPEAVKIRFFVPQSIAQTLKIGQKVTVTGETSFQAKITYISPTSEYTPPIIYSNESNKRLVFMVEAKPEQIKTEHLVIGQPLKVTLDALK